MPLSFRSKRALAAVGSWITLAGSLGAAAWLHWHGGFGGGVPLVAFAEGETTVVASMVPGRVSSVAVAVGDEVRAGQVVATLDPSSIDLEIAVAEAEAARIAARIASERTLTERRLDDAIVQLRRDLAVEREQAARAKAEASALLSEMSRLRKLVDGQLAARDELARLDLRYSAVRPAAEGRPAAVAELWRRLEEVEKRRSGRGSPASGSDAALAVAPLSRELEAAARRLEQLRDRRAGLTLRAASDGKVIAVHRRTGEVVASAEPVVGLVRTNGRVSACLPEREASGAEVGARARLTPRRARGAPAMDARVVAIGPLVSELPARCWRSPLVRTWGRVATLELDAPAALVAGEAFDAEIAASGASPAGDAGESGLSPDAPRPMHVPDPLRARSRFEPSGVLWQPELSRYLVVSDDTGHEKDREHAPWLFTMSAGGEVDAEPLVIEGLSEVNDIESIARSPGGGVYLLASQSHSRKGKRPPARKAFLELAPSGRGFRKARSVALADALEDAGPAALAALGLPRGTRDLEVEGMAAHRGALYLGLKAPLDDEGRALVWRLASPDALLETGSLAGAGLTLWARVRLDAEVDGASVPGGISDLLVLHDGSLLLTSTASAAEGAMESGRLWHASARSVGSAGRRAEDEKEGQELAARLLRTFPGLRPEGVSLSAMAGRAMIVFDAGAGAPSWVDLPWPL